MPEVSVIMPTYNQAAYLPVAVQSVLDQNEGNLELIIVNDGSTDGTMEYLDTLDDPRVKVMHQPNQGASAAMNAGFAQCTGRFLTWLASDNALRPMFLTACLKAMDDHPEIGLVYTDFDNMDDSGCFLDTVRLSPFYPGLLLINPGAVGVGFLYRRGLYLQVGAYHNLICNDLDYWLRAARNWNFLHLPERLILNRKHLAMQTVVRRSELALQVEQRLAEEMLHVTEADPCIMDHLLALRRVGERLGRAVKLRLPPGESSVVVVGPSPLADMVKTILGWTGFQARITEQTDSIEAGEICLALNQEIWALLVNKGLPVVRLDADHATGNDF